MKKRAKIIYTPFVKIDSSKCVKCWKCAHVCPKQVFKSSKFLGIRYFVFGDLNACNGCQKCVHICPAGVFSKIADE